MDEKLWRSTYSRLDALFALDSPGVTCIRIDDLGLASYLDDLRRLDVCFYTAEQALYARVFLVQASYDSSLTWRTALIDANPHCRISIRAGS